MQNLCSSLPLGARFEPRITGHEIAQIRMKLILRSHVELERVEQGDERLSMRKVKDRTRTRRSAI
jgi:hypothetical protein